MLRAVTFDLWETLIHEDPAAEQARRDHRVREIRAVLARYGLDPDPDTLEKAHREVFVRMEAYWSSALDVSVLEQTKMFIELAIGQSVDGRVPGSALLECAKHYGEASLKHPPTVAEGARSVLTVARACGLQLGLICNTGRTPGKVIREILKNFGLADLFVALTFSDEARIRKPAKDVFLRTLQRLGCDPSLAVHVGDQAETDIAGARAAGMRTIYLRRGSAPLAESDYVVASIGELPAILGKLSEGTTRSGARPGDETVVQH
jgi:putative hydrolase of the HAD superfamily